MFTRITTFIMFCFFALCASAAVVSRGDSQCNTGPVQCCNSVHEVESSPVNTLIGLLNLVIDIPAGLVGFNCSPLSVIGVGSNSCDQHPVCCTNNSYNGLIVIGCSPVIINF